MTPRKQLPVGTRVRYEGHVVIGGAPSVGPGDIGRGALGTVIGEEPPAGVIVSWDQSITCVVHRDDISVIQR